MKVEHGRSDDDDDGDDDGGDTRGVPPTHTRRICILMGVNAVAAVARRFFAEKPSL